MKYAPSILLAFLLLLSLPAMAVVASSPSSVDGVDPVHSTTGDRISSGLVDVENATNRLTVDGAIRRGYTSAGPDFGATLATADDELRADHDRFVLEREFDGLSAEEREDAIDATYDLLAQRIETIEQREQVAVVRHANGELSDGALRTVLVRNYHDAATLRADLEELNEYANAVPGYSISSEVRADRGVLTVYQSSVRAQLAAASGGTHGSDPIDSSLETSETGFVISTLDGSTYDREAVRFDNRDTTQPSQFESNTDAFEYVVDELYPWAFGVSTGSGSVQYTHHQLHRVHATHPHGELEVYLDAGTGEVYREIQQLSVGTLPVTERGTWTNETLELSVNSTAVNGPVEVTVTDVETGEPVDATIVVDEEVLVETGADGTVWILPPASEYELTATSANETVTATISSG